MVWFAGDGLMDGLEEDHGPGNSSAKVNIRSISEYQTSARITYFGIDSTPRLDGFSVENDCAYCIGELRRPVECPCVGFEERGRVIGMG